MKRKNIIKIIGGKVLIAKWIISHFVPHRTYVEVFGGGANVLLQKPKARLEIFNDLNEDLINFYKVVLEQESDFFQRCLCLPYSRQLHDEWRDDWEKGYKGKDKTERAIRWYYLQNTGFGGQFGGSFSTGQPPTAFYSKVKSMPFLIKRFQNVIIENLDFEECIKKFDSKDTLFYCDPPYVGTENYYGKGFGEKDHLRLAEILNTIQGKVVLSYYPKEQLKKYYKNWWIDFQYRTKSSTGVEKGAEKPDSTELLLMNYKLPKLITLKEYLK